MPQMIEISVVLPAPFGPSSAKDLAALDVEIDTLQRDMTALVCLAEGPLTETIGALAPAPGDPESRCMTSPFRECGASTIDAVAASRAASYGHGGRSVHFKHHGSVRRAPTSARRLRALRIPRPDGVIGP